MLTLHADPTAYFVLFLAALWAGAQNALAGGGSFITLPALMFTGMDARAANITSTVALFPGQVATGWTGRKFVAGVEGLPFRALVIISFVGGALGAVLLLATPASFFALLVPWLVLFATGVFAWGSFAPKRKGPALGPRAAGLAQFVIAVYGGYFGGGIGFLMLAALTLAGQAVRTAGATKNMLAGVMNASALLIFVFSPEVHWMQALVACVGAICGGVAGAHLLNRVNEKLLRAVVVLVGLTLTVGLFLRAA
jgi:uncharacterized membrane protein YfcA